MYNAENSGEQKPDDIGKDKAKKDIDPTEVGNLDPDKCKPPLPMHGEGDIVPITKKLFLDMEYIGEHPNVSYPETFHGGD
jgi:hypothetical protein